MNTDMPDALAQRPLYSDGPMPIPWANEYDEPNGGTSTDFTVVNNDRIIEAAQSGLCGACGQELNHWVAFIGDSRSVHLRTFGFPPMHEACARYALTACPHINRKQRRRPPPASVFRHDARAPQFWTEPGPELWILGLTNDFKLLNLHGYLVFFAAQFKVEHIFDYDKHGHLRQLS